MNCLNHKKFIPLIGNNNYYHLIITSPHYLTTTSPHYLVITSPYHLITLLPLHLITLLSLHLITSSPHHLITSSPYYHFTSLPHYHFTLLSLHLIIISPRHLITSLPYYHFTSSPYYLMMIITLHSTKQIFEKIAHSSIMRLNKNSMDKLFDLMIMSFKHQILFSNSPQQYLQITLNHLESLRYMMIHYSSTPDIITGPFKSQISSPKIQKGSIVIPLINNIISRIIELYGNFSSLQWLSLKQSLYLFFQGKRIKISLFLQQNIQNLDGNFLFENNPKLPYGTEKPGIVRSYDSNNSIITNKFISEIGIDSIESNEILDKSSSLGFNMFDNSCKPPPIIFESTTELESALMTYIETKKSDKSDRNKVSSSSSRSLSTAKGIISLSFLIIIII